MKKYFEIKMADMYYESYCLNLRVNEKISFACSFPKGAQKRIRALSLRGLEKFDNLS